MNSHELITQLVSEELIDPQEPSPDQSTPWYLHVLGVAGAWFATLLLMLFWLLTIRDNTFLWTVVGLMQAAVAVAILQFGKSELLLHPSLSLWLTGCSMASVGMGRFGSDFEPYTAMAVLFALSFIYPNPLGRLLTLLGAGGCLCVSVMDGHRFGQNYDIALLTLALSGGLLFLMQERLWRLSSYAGRLVRPMGLAAFLTLMQVLIFCQWGYYGAKIELSTAVVLVFAILWLAARLVHKTGVGLAGSVWSLGAVLVVGAITIHSPGIIVGIGILLVGFTVHDRVVQALALAYLATFLSGFYYSLNLLLVDKSITLLALGVVLLLLRRALVRSAA